MLSTLVNTHHIKINLNATSKDELFQELVDVLHANNRISDKAQFLADIQQREADSITCMDGIAYPHAKSKAVLEPAIAAGIKKETIAYGDEDGVEPFVILHDCVIAISDTRSTFMCFKNCSASSAMSFLKPCITLPQSNKH